MLSLLRSSTEYAQIFWDQQSLLLQLFMNKWTLLWRNHWRVPSDGNSAAQFLVDLNCFQRILPEWSRNLFWELPASLADFGYWFWNEDGHVLRMEGGKHRLKENTQIWLQTDLRYFEIEPEMLLFENVECIDHESGKSASCECPTPWSRAYNEEEYVWLGYLNLFLHFLLRGWSAAEDQRQAPTAQCLSC